MICELAMDKPTVLRGMSSRESIEYTLVYTYLMYLCFALEVVPLAGSDCLLMMYMGQLVPLVD